jgi:hypothetical protein
MTLLRLRGCRFPFAALLAGLVTVACSSAPTPLAASGPIIYPAAVSPPVERVAILVTITNRSTDDLQINPADFVARDSEHRIYAANPMATGTDANLVRLATGPRLEVLPLPTVTLRQADIVSGFVVFDVPAGVRPVELVWRQSDNDRVVPLASVG